jgi:1-aminocyclopropane-1-carboxylate deaminase
MNLLENVSLQYQHLDYSLYRAKSIDVFLVRSDKVHPHVSGNKWFKLKYALQQAKQQNVETLISFGGAYSNHIHALAYAAQQSNIKTIGFIRGQWTTDNQTLQDAQKWGMQLHSLSREAYREKHTQPFLDDLKQKYPNSIIIAEGGSGVLAVKGVADLMQEIESSLPNLDVLVAACGTGGTLAGLVAGAQHTQSILGIPVLKGAQFLNQDIEQLLAMSEVSVQCDWQLDLDGHYGGYGKVKAEHVAQMQAIEQRHQVVLEPVYVAKMWRRFDELVSQDYFTPGAKIALLHSGGLQGRRGFKALS